MLSDYDAAVRSQFSHRFEPNTLEDIAWYRDYVSSGTPGGSPILLSMGENWEGPPDALLAKLRSAPAHLHGYQFSMWGETCLVETLMEWLPAEYGLHPDAAVSVAACWSGTRGALFDLGRMIGARQPGARLVYATPGYDYGNVMSPGGLTARPVDVLQASQGDVSYDHLLDVLDASVAALILNIQHNPLACQVPAPLLEEIFARCLRYGIVPIFDDAHVSVVEPGTARVDGLKLWLDAATRAGGAVEWYLVRSFGKQLNCNGWGIGVIAGPPPELRRWVLEVRTQHAYSIQAAQQWAIAQHLASGEASLDADRFCIRIANNRTALKRDLPDFAPLTGQVCTPFSWFRLPARFNRPRIMRETGVLLGRLIPSPMQNSPDPGSLARIYLGVREEIFNAALSRLVRLF